MMNKGRHVSFAGEQHSSAILTNADVANIKGLLPNYPRRTLARCFGVSGSTIDHIATGLNWRDIEASPNPVLTPNQASIVEQVLVADLKNFLRFSHD
jgi:hypothetical protein